MGTTGKRGIHKTSNGQGRQQTIINAVLKNQSTRVEQAELKSAMTEQAELKSTKAEQVELKNTMAEQMELKSTWAELKTT